jgi:GNAT superfamily N-acetyltransferase
MLADMTSAIRIVEADLARAEHQRDVVAMTNAYAMDPMGNGAPLPAATRDRLIDGLRRVPTTLVLLAYAGDQAVGIATCFHGFSTFYAKPLINIHDLAVLPSERGRGVGRALLAAVEQRARTLGCCKITLEVQELNARARRTYEAHGFAQAVYGDPPGGCLFYAKVL